MKLLKQLSLAKLGSKKTKQAPESPEEELKQKPIGGSKDVSTEQSSPTKSTDSQARKSIKDRLPQNVDFEGLALSPQVSSPSRKKKKKKKKTKRKSSIRNSENSNSIQSEVTKSERGGKDRFSPTSPSIRGKKRKKKRRGSSRRSETSTIAGQSLMLTTPDQSTQYLEAEHTSIRSKEGDEGEDEAWFGNFGPNQAIMVGMPNLDGNDERDFPEGGSMQSDSRIPNFNLPKNSEDMDDSKISLDNSCVMEELPPIGELVVGFEELDDQVSEIGEPTIASSLEFTAHTGRQTTAPDEHDVCFDDRGHPGTRVLTKMIRDLLEENEWARYTISMGKLIRRKLKGRKLLIKQQENGSTTWRVAEKSETDQLLADWFEGERQRRSQGMDDDDSDENSSLQDSAQQSELSLSLERLVKLNDEVPPPSPPPLDEATDKPLTPKINNSSRDFKVIDSSEKAGEEMIEELLAEIIQGRKIAEEYASPFGDDDLRNGHNVEKTLCLLQEKSMIMADNEETDQLKMEIQKIDEAVERVKYASIGPLLEMLEKIDEKMTILGDQVEASSNYNDAESKLNERNGKGLAPTADLRRKNPTLGTNNDQNDSLNSLESYPKLNSNDSNSRNIRSGSKRPRMNSCDSNSRSIRSGSKRSGSRGSGSFSKRTMDEEAHPRARGYSDEDQLEASEIFDEDPSEVVVEERQGFQSSEEDLYESDAHEAYPAYDEEYHEEGSEVEVPLNDQVDYSMDVNGNSSHGGSRERSFDDTNRTIGSSSFGIDELHTQASVGDTAYTVPLKGGSSSNVLSSASFSSDYKSQSKGTYAEYTIDEENSQGSQSLRMDGLHVGHSMETSVSERSTQSGHVILAEHKPDDISSVGQSDRRLYGSDSEDGTGEYEEITEHDDDDTTVDSDASSKFEEETLSVKTKEVGNARLEQFLDRLQHFFEVRRKVEERTDIIDSSGKLRRMKMKVTSGGLQQKGYGQYSDEYQQRDTSGEVVKSLDDLYFAAEKSRPALLKVLDSLTDEVMGLDIHSAKVAELKPRDRAFEKAKEEYGERRPGPPESWLFDVVRASVVCKSYKQMSDVNKWLAKNTQVVKAKNRFLTPAINGYRDLLFHILVPFQGDLCHVCEIQVHHRDMKALDTQYGLPKHYEFFRSSFASPSRVQENTLDDLALMNKHGDVGSMMVKLMRSKDTDQLRLFARLCREKLDEFDKALELYRRILVLQLQKDELGSDDGTLADTHLNIGLVYGNKGDIDESLNHLQKALKIQAAGAGADNPLGAELMTEVGRMLSKKGDFEGALINFELSLEIRESVFGNEHFMVISSLQDIGQAFSDMGDFTASEVSYRKALKIQEKMFGDVHPDIAITSRLIGTTLCKYGDFGTSMELHRLALSIRETSLGKNHPMAAESQTDIGIVLCLKGDLENAEWRHRKALRIREMKGKDDEDCAISLSHLGDVLSQKGEYAEAVNTIKRAQKIREGSLGMDHPVTAATYIDLGNIYYKQGDSMLALKEYRRAKVARESILGHGHQETAVALSCLGNALNLQGDYQAAHKAHLQALNIYLEVLGERHPLSASGYQNIADTLLLMGDKEKALVQHRKALAIRANVLSKDHPDTALSCSRIGDLLAEKDDLVGALVAHRQALAITVGLSGEETAASAKAHIHVGLVLAAQGEFDEAVEEFEQGTSVLENVLGESHEETARAYGLIGSVHSARGDFEDALDMHSQALEVYQSLLGDEHPKSIAAAKKCHMAENRIAETEF